MDLDKFKGCILGAAIGDTLGMPMETMSREKIQKIKGLTSNPVFLSPSVNRRLFVSLRHLQPGQWTDDTQLTLATMEALMESGGTFDMDKIAQKHIEAYRGERRGWGKSTTNSCRRLARGVSWRDSGEPGGAGNGVMMKIAPLGLRQSVKQLGILEFSNDCVAYAQMTHLGSQAVVAGAIHVATIAWLAKNTSDMNRFNDFYSVKFTLLDDLYFIALVLERALSPDRDKISTQINRIRAYLIERAENKNPDIVPYFGNGTSYAYNSFGLSYALFLSNPHSFSVVWEAACAGGDTDSNASIVGSLYGALNGMSGIPQHLLSGLERREYIEDLTEKFFNAVKEGGKNV